MDQLYRIWRDPVWSKIIAYIIIWICTSLIGYFDFVHNVLRNKVLNRELTKLESVLLISIVSLILLSIILFILYTRKKNIQKRYHNLYHSRTGTIIPIDKLKKQSPQMKRIAISGLGDVGKTTLIKNFSNALRSKERTYGKGCYVVNLSNNSYNYAAILDGTGQKIDIQNSLILEADIVIFIVDHNISNSEVTIDNERLFEHNTFVEQAIDKMIDEEHFPPYIYILLNKKDLWKQNLEKDQEKLIKASRKLEEFIQETLPRSTVIYRPFSNEETALVTKLQHNLINKL